MLQVDSEMLTTKMDPIVLTCTYALRGKGQQLTANPGTWASDNMPYVFDLVLVHYKLISCCNFEDSSNNLSRLQKDAISKLWVSRQVVDHYSVWQQDEAD